MLNRVSDQLYGNLSSSSHNDVQSKFLDRITSVFFNYTILVILRSRATKNLSIRTTRFFGCTALRLLTPI